MEFTTKKIAENFWAIEQNGVRSFLLTGRGKAVLVDTCFGGDILSVCRSLTSNPITLITTHADPDHMGCDAQFPDQCLHEADFERYRSRSKTPIHAKPLHEGDLFNLEDYRLEVIQIPGHTPGSIALLDRAHRFLISGDTVQAGCIFMHGEGRDLPTFRSSIIKLDTMRREGLFDTVFPSHGEAVVPADILEDHLALAEDVLSGTAVPAGPAPDWFPDTVKTYRHGRAQMYYAY
ncbi:MAG: MBL fold metallo-hydrolase [Oscillospiraceae bacterium]|nr:MBL fold metallo-hydrolase [Oscillospiraceae bacterium]